jgi:hypothetical protein
MRRSLIENLAWASGYLTVGPPGTHAQDNDATVPAARSPEPTNPIISQLEETMPKNNNNGGNGAEGRGRAYNYDEEMLRGRVGKLAMDIMNDTRTSPVTDESIAGEIQRRDPRLKPPDMSHSAWLDLVRSVCQQHQLLEGNARAGSGAAMSLSNLPQQISMERADALARRLLNPNAGIRIPGESPPSAALSMDDGGVNVERVNAIVNRIGDRVARAAGGRASAKNGNDQDDDSAMDDHDQEELQKLVDRGFLASGASQKDDVRRELNDIIVEGGRYLSRHQKAPKAFLSRFTSILSRSER